MKRNCPTNPMAGAIGFFKVALTVAQFKAHPKLM